MTALAWFSSVSVSNQFVSLRTLSPVATNAVGRQCTLFLRSMYGASIFKV